MPQTAVIYIRVSSTEQKDGLGLERQKTKAFEFAAEHSWYVEKVISDEGKSAFHGANMLEGAALHQFELEARQGLHKGKVLLVEHINRLSRQGAKQAAQLIWSLNGFGVDVATFSTSDRHIYRAGDGGDMIDIFKVVILADQAHQESKVKSGYTKATWEKRFAAMADGTQTKPIPHTPTWIDRIDGKLVLNEHRTAVLNEIYDLYINGVGIHRIVTILNDRGEAGWSTAVNRSKNGWFYSYVWRLLTKRAVLGEYVTGDGKTIAADFYPQAITAEKFNRAQVALGMRKSNRKVPSTRNNSLLTKLVYCSECGGGAHFEETGHRDQTYKRKNGETAYYRRQRYRRLRCDRARRKHNCDNPTILKYDVIEKTVLDELLPRLVDRPQEGKAVKELRVSIAELGRQVALKQQQQSNLLDALGDGASKAVMGRLAALEAETEAQQKELEAKNKQLAILLAAPSDKDDTALIAGLRAELESKDDEIRTYARGRVNMALRRLVHRIEITPYDTFIIWPDEDTWWRFDENGLLLDGEQIWRVA